MRYAKAFFDLQVELAETVAVQDELPLARALMEYTNLYIRFGLGRAFDLAHPGWQEYVTGLKDADDAREWTYRFYESCPESVAPPGVVATSGCFSYARSGDDRIRLHFHDAEDDGDSPLGIARRERRRAELAALLAHVKRTVRGPVTVAGASWLYNLDAYRRLFPPSYVATARVLPRRFQHMPLWGQFVDRRGEVKARVADQFLDRLGRRVRSEDLDRCFPLQVLAVEAPAQEFYDFYEV